MSSIKDSNGHLRHHIEENWLKTLKAEFDSEYFKVLDQFVKEESLQHTIFPPLSVVFEAYNLTPFEKVKVVIIGQDPYHGPGQAHGLSFSVPAGVPIPPSLRNIFKEIHLEYGGEKPKSSDLTSWAKQGVLLLNATLTVRQKQAGSHQKKGWEKFTDATIRVLSERRERLVFVLWGNYARKKKAMIDETKHLILEAPHPSPLSAYHGFLGCGHFKSVNEFLSDNNIDPIIWA